MNSPISWVGGKMKARDIICDRFPPSFERYIEVFGGGGWVLFHKSRHAKFEVYNDLDSNLVNLFRMLREDAEAVIKEFEYTLNSIEMFREIKEMFDAGTYQDKAALAANFFLLTKLSYGNRRETYSYQQYDVRTAFGTFRAAHNRLAGIIIDNRDFERVIRHYDGTDAFFYCDPPYFEAESFYKVPFVLDDHLRLRELLGDIKGKFLLSYNDCDFVRELYKGFEIYAYERINNLALGSDGYEPYKELLIANYDMDERGRQHEQISLLDFS